MEHYIIYIKQNKKTHLWSFIQITKFSTHTIYEYYDNKHAVTDPVIKEWDNKEAFAQKLKAKAIPQKYINAI